MVGQPGHFTVVGEGKNLSSTTSFKVASHPCIACADIKGWSFPVTRLYSGFPLAISVLAESPPVTDPPVDSTLDRPEGFANQYLERGSPGDLHRIGSADHRTIGPLGAIAVGGPQDFYMLSKRHDWNLPFQVWGYYDLRAHEAVPVIH